MKSPLLLFLSLICVACTQEKANTQIKAQSQEIISGVYEIKEGDSLGFDYYQPKLDSLDELPALVLFVHGGGFYSGVRDDASVVNFCQSLSDSGIAAVAISYRLHLKGSNFHCNQPTENKIRAIEKAAIDAFDAITYMKKSDFQFDREKIIFAGSSAGGEAVLHGAFMPIDSLNYDSSAFCGIISLAGAVHHLENLDSNRAKPILLFHGTCDPLVPYHEGIHHYCPKSSPGGMMLYGSLAIAESYEELGANYKLISKCGAGHAMASRPLTQNIDEIIEFIRQAPFIDAEFQEHRVIKGEEKCSYPHPVDCLN